MRIDAAVYHGGLVSKSSNPSGSPYAPFPHVETRAILGPDFTGDLAELRIYDAPGRMVRTLVDELMTAGQHAAVWDGRDTSGQSVASGVYFYRLQAGDVSATRRMLLLK